MRSLEMFEFLDLDLAVGGGHGCAIQQLEKPFDEGTYMVCWGLDSEGQASPPRPELP